MGGGLLFLLLFIFLIVGTPVFIGIALASIIFMTIEGIDFFMVVQRMYSGIDRITLLALPGFLIAGNLMDQGGLAKRLVSLMEVIIGRLPGGLPIVTIGASAIFGAISGSGMATTAVMGNIMLPEMKARGYKGTYVGALVTAGGVLDSVIPPSMVLVIYGSMTGTSIGDLFKAGFSVGLVAVVFAMLTCVVLSKWHNIDIIKKYYSAAEVFTTLRKAILALLAPVLIIVGIFGGYFTPTECAVVLIVYVIIVCGLIFRELNLKGIWEAFKKAALQSSALALIIGSASLFGWIVGYLKVPDALVSAAFSITDNKYLILILVNLAVMTMGMFVAGSSLVAIIAPMMIPLCLKLGLHPVAFGSMILLNLALGQMTPPFGQCLFVSAMVTKEPVEKITVQTLPFVGTHLIVLALVIFFPQIPLFFV